MKNKLNDYGNYENGYMAGGMSENQTNTLKSVIAVLLPIVTLLSVYIGFVS